MEKDHFFILEKSFLISQQVYDLIDTCGAGGVETYMMFLMYLRHQPGYVACYTRSSLEHLAQCSRGTVELFSNVLLNFGGSQGHVSGVDSGPSLVRNRGRNSCAEVPATLCGIGRKTRKNL